MCESRRDVTARVRWGGLYACPQFARMISISLSAVYCSKKPIYEGGAGWKTIGKSFISISGRPKKLPPSMKSRIINLYDPMADRSHKF
jgi:hypothetical protein